MLLSALRATNFILINLIPTDSLVETGSVIDHLLVTIVTERTYRKNMKSTKHSDYDANDVRNKICCTVSLASNTCA